MALKRAYDNTATSSNVTLLTVTADTKALIISVVIYNSLAAAKTYKLFIEDGSDATHDIVVWSGSLAAYQTLHIDTRLVLSAADKLKCDKESTAENDITTWVSYDEA